MRLISVGGRRGSKRSTPAPSVRELQQNKRAIERLIRCLHGGEHAMAGSGGNEFKHKECEGLVRLQTRRK